MKVVAVVNQKGGVAKTTTTANLGASLAMRGHATLLVDLDPQANLTLGLRGEASGNLPSLPEVLMSPDTVPLAGIAQAVGELPLFLAPGHLQLARTEATLVARGIQPYQLRRALKHLEGLQAFEYALIDCPPSLGILTQNAIVASTHLVVPTEPKMYALAGMDILNRMIESLSEEFSFQIDLLGVLLTMFERRTRLHRIIGALIRERFGDKVFDTVLHRTVRISEAEVEGQPLLLLDPHAPAAQEYAALADEVVERTRAWKPAATVVSPAGMHASAVEAS